MIPAAKLKAQLEFNNDLGSIIDVLKVAASMQLRQLQMQRPINEDFLAELKESTSLIDVSRLKHPLLTLKEDLPRCVVAITSDEGFLGELNTLVINSALDRRKNSQKDMVVVIGERGAGYLRDLDVEHKAFAGIPDRLKQEQVEEIKNYLVDLFAKGDIGEVVVVYPKFVSITTHRLEASRLLPFSFEAGTQAEKTESIEELLVEPSASYIVGGLAKLWLSSVMANIFFSSKLSEFSARLMHLDKSEQELKQINRKLRLEYFRYMHVISDRTIREVSASRFISKH